MRVFRVSKRSVFFFQGSKEEEIRTRRSERCENQTSQNRKWSMDSSFLQNEHVSLDILVRFSLSNLRRYRYKKWLNKSKITDRELPDSRRRPADDSTQGDDMSSAHAKPRTKILRRINSFSSFLC